MAQVITCLEYCILSWTALLAPDWPCLVGCADPIALVGSQKTVSLPSIAPHVIYLGCSNPSGNQETSSPPFFPRVPAAAAAMAGSWRLERPCKPASSVDGSGQVPTTQASGGGARTTSREGRPRRRARHTPSSSPDVNSRIQSTEEAPMDLCGSRPCEYCQLLQGDASSGDGHYGPSDSEGEDSISQGSTDEISLFTPVSTNFPRMFIFQ